MNISWPTIISILGSCGSGKSYSIKYLLKVNRDHFNYVIIFTSTGFTNSYNYLNEYGVNSTTFNTMDVERKIKSIMIRQKKYKQAGYNFNILIVFDDIMGAVKPYSNELKLLLSTYRHYNISIIFVSQYANSIPTYIRELSSYALVFNQFTLPSLKACYSSYFAEHDSLSKFNQWFKNKLNVKYSFYFVDRVSKSKIICKAPANL